MHFVLGHSSFDMSKIFAFYMMIFIQFVCVTFDLSKISCTTGMSQRQWQEKKSREECFHHFAFVMPRAILDNIKHARVLNYNVNLNKSVWYFGIKELHDITVCMHHLQDVFVYFSYVSKKITGIIHFITSAIASVSLRWCMEWSIYANFGIKWRRRKSEYS